MKLLLSVVMALIVLTGCKSTAPAMLTSEPAKALASRAPGDNKIYTLLQASKRTNSSPAIRLLINNAEVNINLPEPLYELAYAHLQHAKAAKNNVELDLAENYFNAILLLVPGNQAVMISLYNIYYDNILHERNTNALEQAQQLFLQLPLAVRSTMNPPSLAKFVATAVRQKAQQQPDRQELREILLHAIQEQPSNDKAYIQLGKIYADDRYFALAIATLKLGAENITDSVDLYNAIANTYEKRAYVNNCNYEHPSDIANAIKYYKLAVPLAPDSQELHYNLANALIDQQQNRLGLHESNIALELNSTSATLSITAQDYSILGYPQQATELLELAIAKGLTISETSYHEINMNLGQWQKAADGFSAYSKAQDSFTVYDFIKSEIIAQQSQRQPWLTQDKITFGNKWEENLFNYWNSNLSDDTFKKLAHNRCEKTEYYFYSGYKDLRNGQSLLAKAKFAAAIKQNTYRFIERPLAQYFLRE